MPTTSANETCSHDHSAENAACGCSAPSPAVTPTATHNGCGCGHHSEPDSGALPAHKCNCQGLMRYRKAHSLAGAIFGLFLAGHLAISATGLSPSRFDQNAQALHTLASNLPGVDLLVAGLPLLVIVPCGLFLLWKAGLTYNVKKCQRGGKLRFFLQRASALALLAFLVIHLTQFGPLAPRTTYHASNAFASTAATLRGTGLSGFFTGLVYFLGVIAVAFHLANGLWTGAIAWKLAETPAAKSALNKLAIVVGLVIAAAGIAAWSAFTLLAGQ